MNDMNCCCYGCTKRAVGCRETCEAWAEHERQKAERYAKQDAERVSRYGFSNCPMTINGEKKRVREIKRKGGAF